MRLSLNPLMVLAAIVVTTASGCESNIPTKKISANDGNTTTVNATTAPAQGLPMLATYCDKSGSESDREIEAAAPDITRSLASNARKISGVEVVRFADGNSSIWAAPTKNFYWGSPPTLKEFDPDLEHAPNEAKMFTRKREEYINQKREAFNSAATKSENDYKSTVDYELTQLRSYLVEKPTAKAQCTRFRSLAQRIEREGLDHNLVITDGWNDCPEERGGKMTPVKVKGKIGIVLVTRQNDGSKDDQDFLRRESFLHQIFPDAKIFPSFQAAKAVEAALE